MTDPHDGTQPAGGWRPPEPASEATFVAPPPAAPPASPAATGWPPPPVTDASAAPGWPPPAAGAPAWPQPEANGPSGAPAWPPPRVAGDPHAGTWTPAAAAPAAPPRSTSVLVVLAAIFLLIAGLLTLGMGAVLLLGSALFAGAGGTAELEEMIGGDLAGALAGMLAVIGGVAALFGLAEIVGGAGMLARQTWGRAIGLVVGVFGLLFWGLSLLAALGAPADAGSGIGFAGAFVAGYVLTIVALLTGGAHFRRG